PDQSLDGHIAVLQDRQRKAPKELAAATRDANWLLSPDAKASAEVRGKAHFVKGLALRNQDKYDDARKDLAEAIKLGADSKDAWVKQAQVVQKSLTDPSSYIQVIEKSIADGDLPRATAELDWALKIMPADGRLLAWRSMIDLENARRAGKTAAA